MCCRRARGLRPALRAESRGHLALIPDAPGLEGLRTPLAQLQADAGRLCRCKLLGFLAERKANHVQTVAGIGLLSGSDPHLTCALRVA